MPNIVITPALAAQSVAIPAGTNTVSFQGEASCTVCFQNAQTFGVSSFQLAAGRTATFVVAHRISTKFTVLPPGSPCAQQAFIVDSPGVHTIGMG